MTKKVKVNPAEEGWEIKDRTYMLRGDKKLTAILNHEHTDWGYYDKDSLPRPFEDRMRQVLELNL